MNYSILLLFLVYVNHSAASNITEAYRSITTFRDCLSSKHPIVCVKEKALDAINETIYSDQPLDFYGLVQIERNPEYQTNGTEDHLPEGVKERSLKLSDILHDKVEDYLRSRTIKFNLDNAFEGRGKKDGKKGGMMMMGMLGVGCMMAQLMLGKIAFLAGTALIIAKVALFLSAIVGFKKLASGSSGGETQHVVYASSGDGHSHGGGGWHRSLDDAQNLAYNAHIYENNVGY